MLAVAVAARQEAPTTAADAPLDGVGAAQPRAWHQRRREAVVRSQLPAVRDHEEFNDEPERGFRDVKAAVSWEVGALLSLVTAAAGASSAIPGARGWYAVLEAEQRSQSFDASKSAVRPPDVYLIDAARAAHRRVARTGLRTARARNYRRGP